MSVRRFRRAAAIAALASMLAANVAFADSVRADGDLVSAGYQSLVELGPVAAGASIHVDVGFSLLCAGTKHVNADQSVKLTLGAITVPTGGSASATDTEIAPPASGWPADFESCTGTEVAVSSDEPSHVTLVAPPTAGTGYAFILSWTRTLEPAASGDLNTFTGSTALTFMLDVVGNTPPALSVPVEVWVEGNTTGGANVTFSVGATDAEDEPEPTPTCTPASGSFFPLGTTSVSCSVTDGGGLSDGGAFPVTVVDTTPPSMAGVPGSLSAETTDSSGVSVTYAMPSASDIVDLSPSVECAPASGSTFPVGDTAVHCTARDSSGNVATASFNVHVDFREPAPWSAIWDEPVGAAERLSIAAGRTIPIKVRALVDGREVTSGTARLVVTRCGGGSTVATTRLEWRSGSDRWFANLETSGLAAGCHIVSIVVEDTRAGSFELDVVGSSAPAKANGTTQKAPGSKAKP